jgi:hypothetical protein
LLKAFTECPYVARTDESSAVFAVVHGKQDRTPVRKKKNTTLSSKKKQRQHTALRLLNDPIRSPVNYEFLRKTSTNTIGDLSPGLTIIDTSAWRQLSDPFNPTRLDTANEEADRNVWYLFLYDVFLDGECHVEADEIPSFVT